jgi:uncharacterized repeat protein (TIGR01451 family)
MLPVAIATLIFAACMGGGRAVANSGPCNVETDAATNITATSATLNGQLGVYPGDGLFCGTWWFDYGTTLSYGSMTSPNTAAEGGPTPVSTSVTGLTPNTTYHFRIEASDGMANIGSDLTFHTPAAPPPPPGPSGTVLSIAASATPASVQTGGNTTLAAVVSNTGGLDAGQVIVRDTLPAGLSFVSATSNVGSCAGSATVTCTIGVLGAGKSATVSIVATATAAGVITNTATVDSPDDNSNARSAAATVTATTPAPAPSPSPPAPPPTTTETPPTTGPVNFVVDLSIGGISIGETETSVEKELGSPTRSLPIETPGGHGSIAYYTEHGADFIVTYDETGHVVQIQTYSPFFQTAGGLGPGSSLADVAKLPGFRQDYSCALGYWNGSAATKPTGVVTVFTPNGGLVDSVLITELVYWTACATGSQELPPPVTLTLNHSIGGISIGMTEAAVLKLYGKPLATLAISLGGGLTGKSVRYRIHGAPLLIVYDSKGHVVSIETYSPFFRTAGNLGPGASLTTVQKLPGFRQDFCQLGFWNGSSNTPPTHIVTVFTPNGGLVASVLITQFRLYTACATGSTELPPS